MKKRIVLVLAALLLVTAGWAQEEGKFVQVFNGNDLSGWKLMKPGGFEVENGELVTRSRGNGFDLYTARKYGNFVMRFEFLLSDVGNSGVFIRHDPADPSAGFEVQLLAPWTPWRDDLHCTGSLYGHVAITNRPDETTGKWYSMEIRCDRKMVTVLVDGKVTTMADTDTVKSLAGKPLSGFIGFQSNHSPKKDQFARFRNIFIRDLDAEPDYVLKGFAETAGNIRKHNFETAAALGAVMVTPLAGLVTGKNPAAREGARQALFDIVARVTAPGSDPGPKKEVQKALKKCIKGNKDREAVEYLRRLYAMVK
jgi:hypothetical protein